MTITNTVTLLYPGEAAHLLGVTEAALERWSENGRLTPRHEDGEPRYDADEVRRLIGAAPRPLVGVVALLEEVQAAAALSGDTDVWRLVHQLTQQIRDR